MDHPACGIVRQLPPGQKLRLGLEILITYLEVRVAIRRHPLPDVLVSLRRPPKSADRRRPLPDGRCDGERLGAAVTRALSPLPTNTLCLMQSLVLLRLLARRGGDAKLVIAVAPEEGVELSAHAWLESDRGPLLVPADDGYGRLVSL
jgi:Transglutaminase-like superfamily